MAQLFVSDLHLEDSRPDITRAFFHLLDSFSNRISALYLLGDIFEVWLGDDTPSQCADALADKLADLSCRAVQIFMLHGNRDFLIGNDYALRCGATLIQEPFALTLAGKRALLMHGDALCTQDTDYMAFRTLVRNPQWQRTFLAKSLQERITIGRQLRDKSQASALQKSDYIMDVTADAVVTTMKAHSTELLIHGHTHRPAMHQVALDGRLATRMVLGDWYQQGWYILADDRGIRLEPYPFPSGS